MFLVFDIGGTYIKYAIMEADGTILEKGKTPTIKSDDDGIEDFIENLGTIYDIKKTAYDLEGLACGMPGRIDVEKGIAHTGGGIKFIQDAPLADMISRRCDGLRVSLENDGKCAALAEAWKGNAKDCRNALVILFGTGIGGGIIMDGKVYHGNRQIAGEVSFCFTDMNREDVDNIGCVEHMGVEESYDRVPYLWATTASVRALCSKVAKAKGVPPEEMSGERVYEMAEQGDGLVIDILEDMYFNIAKHICSLYVTLDPDIILIGGGISAQPRFIEGINRYVEKLRRISIMFDGLRLDTCKYRNDSNLLGALYYFKQKYEYEI